MISKQIIFIIEIVLQISRPVAQYYSLFIYRYFYRYLLFSESCLLLFIVPSSCIGCKSSLMVRINNFTRFCCIFKGARFV